VAIVAAALLVGVTAAVAVGSPAMASHCDGYAPFTIVVNSSGNWSGTSGNDKVLISANNATFNPVGGSDIICITATGGTTVWSAGAGHGIFGGPGPDYLYGAQGDDYIEGNGGNDLIAGNGGADTIKGGSGNDYLRGLAGGTWENPDHLSGDSGDDCILGGSGLNILLGGSGNDVLLIGYDHRYSSTQCAPADWDTSAPAQAFRDNVHSGGTPWTIADGGSGNDRIWGTTGVDSIQGGEGDDVIYGWAGNDSINGWGGNDSLNGGAGNDHLNGEFNDGAHSDQLYGGSGSDTLNGDSHDICYPEYGPATTTCS
jgi:Ca2+-binding RTX toxin-like protein